MSGPTRTDGIAVAVLALLAAVLVSSPAAVITDVPLDVFIPLDAGWRAVHGQWPHLDFHTPVGALWYGLYGSCMAAMGPSDRVILVAPVLAAIPVVGAALYAAIGRLQPMPRALVVGFVGLTCFSPRSLDGGALAFLASYNRIGWALVIVGLLLLLLPRPRERSELAEGALLTGILLTLFFLKITYFGVLGLGCGLALVAVPENRKTAVGAGVGAWLLIGVLALVWELPAAYAADLQRAMASAAPGSERTGWVKLVADLWANAAPVGLTVVATGFAAYREQPLRPGLTGLAVLVLGLLTAQQSHDHAIPIAIVAVVLAVGPLATALAESPLIPVAILGLAALGPMAADATAIVQNATLSRSIRTIPAWPGAGIRFVGGPADLHLDALETGREPPEVYFATERQVTGPDMALLLREGQALVLARAGADTRVLTLASSPSMTWLSKTEPPRGVDAWYDYGRTFGPNRPIDTRETLAQVTVAMQPTGLRDPTLDRIADDLLPALNADFTPHETPLWTLWFRD